MLKIYRASAGSGKTHQLTGEYIQLLFKGKGERAYRKILAVTFTNKATDEMKSRILHEMHQLSTGAKSDYRDMLINACKMSEQQVNERARELLVSILHDYTSFSISTIDKFFQQVIRAFAREIGVQGSYNLELDTDTTLQQAIDNLFLELDASENKQLLSWLQQFADERIEHSENWNLRKNIEALGYEIFKENYQSKAEETSKKLHDKTFLANYRQNLRTIQREFEEKVQETAKLGLQLLANSGLNPEDFKGGSRSAMLWLNHFEKGRYELKDSFVAMSIQVEYCYTKTTPKPIIAAIESIYNTGLQTVLIQLCHLMQQDIIQYNSAGIILKYINTLGILSDLTMQVKKLTDDQNSMLISDSNMLLNRIIDQSDAPFVYEKTGININHFMIDEFQDTSGLQWKNFLPLIRNSLASDNLNMVVGDVKQSIYRWRNSDWKLLDSQLYTDFRAGQLEEINLETNWRSDKNIVDFNNTFFKQAALLLQLKLNNILEPTLEALPQLANHKSRILNAYSHIEQKIKPEAGIGFVQFEFIEQGDSDDKWSLQSLNKLPTILEDIQQRGHRPCDVAILVKRNSEANAVVQHLLNYKSSDLAKPGYSYNLMGSEGLLIESASAVRFIIALLKIILNPEDKICRTILDFEYAVTVLKKNPGEALNQQTSIDEITHFSALFTSEQNNTLKNIQNISIYNLVERIISLFDLGNWNNESAFVQGFQDAVFKYSTGKNSDIYSFMKWWEKTGSKQSIATPENADAFNIMTIHKSKGLDFKVVIIPFCDWNFVKKSALHKSFLWTEPTQAPFDQLPVIPVEFSSKLALSVFAPAYFDELMQQYIDNLNVAYVAFTRAKNELICFAPKPKKEAEEIEQVNTLSQLLYGSFTNLSTNIALFRDNFKAENDIFLIGEPNRVTNSSLSTEKLSATTLKYKSAMPEGRLRLRNLNTQLWLASQEVTNNQLQLGTRMHELLQHIIVKEDTSRVMEKFVSEGKINAIEANQLQQMLDKFWQLPETNEWFSPTCKVRNEATILTSGGTLYRPDRVIFNESKATVIDYKLGEQFKKEHTEQVKNYMQLIQSMGYTANGYLCYITLNQIIEVK